VFRNTHHPHLPFFFLDVPFRDRIPFSITAPFLLFIGAFKIRPEDVLLICRKVSGWE